jgi:hypothetical protein
MKKATKIRTKRLFVSLILTLSLVLTAAVLSACSKKKAIWLEDGQTVSCVDNSLGEGTDNNVKLTHSYTNKSEVQNPGKIYKAGDRYFAQIVIGKKLDGITSDVVYVEITDIKNGGKIDKSAFINATGGTTTNPSAWGVIVKLEGFETLSDGKSQSTVSTKYCYQYTKDKRLNIWGDREITTVITYPDETTLSFTLVQESAETWSWILSQTGDSYEVK